jgi:hypothetical protein
MRERKKRENEIIHVRAEQPPSGLNLIKPGRLSKLNENHFFTFS